MTLKNNRAPLLSIIKLYASFHHHMNSNWSYSPETVKLGVDLCDLDLWPLTLIFCMDVTFVIGNNSWKFHDDTMMGTWWKMCDGRTDGQTDRRTDGLNQSYSCLVAANKKGIGNFFISMTTCGMPDRNYFHYFLCVWSWQTHCVIMASLLRQNDVILTYLRHNDVVLTL